MIRLIDFSIGFSSHPLLKNVSELFPASNLTALIGRNGTGKSTLLKAICGINNNYKGSILIEGLNVKDIPRHLLAKKLAYVNTQHPRLSNLRCLDVVSLGRSPHTGWYGRLSDEDTAIIDNAIRQVGMMEYKDRYFNSLSDGECQKIMIARAIAQDTPIILLDEPTSFLDLPTRYELVTILRDLCHCQGKTIIYSTHELDIALKLSDRIAVLEDTNLLNYPAAGIPREALKSLHPFE